MALVTVSELLRKILDDRENGRQTSSIIATLRSHGLDYTSILQRAQRIDTTLTDAERDAIMACADNSDMEPRCHCGVKIKPNEQARDAMRAVAADLRLIAEANERASVVARAAILALEDGDIAVAHDRMHEMRSIGLEAQPRINLLDDTWARVSMLDPVAWSAAVPRSPAAPARPPRNVTVDTTVAIDDVAKILGLHPQVVAQRLRRHGSIGSAAMVSPVELLETADEAKRALALHEQQCGGGVSCFAHREIVARIRQLGGAP